MTRILVTGGCGFIGREVVHAVMSAGHDVRVLDDLSTHSVPGLPGGVAFAEGSVGDPEALARAMEGMDACVHLSGSPVTRSPRSDPATTIDHFAPSALAFFDAAADAGVSVVYASSAAVYGPVAEGLIRETDVPAPVNAHGMEKAALEQAAVDLFRERGGASIGLRMFNVFGAGQSPESPYCGVVRLFAEKLLNGDKAVIRGDGRQERDFVYIDDAVRAVVAALNRTPAAAEVVNICSGRSIALTDVVAALEDAAGAKLDVEYMAEADPGVPHSVGDTALARELLGFETKVDFRAGVRSMMARLQSGRA